MTLIRMHFPSDYVTSRSRFRESADRLGWIQHTHPMSGVGPDGEELSIDAAITSNSQADHVVIISSGLHGVEGPFGTAVQLAVMDEWNKGTTIPDNVRCVFLHGLNPHGYAWNRRSDADNVDPNRNFLLPGQEYRGCPDGYTHFDPLLNPKRPPARWDFWTLRAWWSLFRFGLPALKESIVVGQYDFPKGIFFGGHGPCATHLALDHLMKEWIGRAASVVHLDFHTGLGKYGSYKLLLDNPLTKDLQVRLDRWFGPDTYEQDDSKGVAYQPRGSFGPWCIAQQLANEYLYLVAEFGTYGSVAMLGGIRAENQAHHWGQPNGRAEVDARARLKELFCPADPAWRKRVLEQGVKLVHQAVEAMAENKSGQTP